MWDENVKALVCALVVLLGLLQYNLWFMPGGVIAAWKLRYNIQLQQQRNAERQEQNAVLTADIKDLRSGDEAIAERARNELGMIRPGEKFYQIIQYDHQEPAKK